MNTRLLGGVALAAMLAVTACSQSEPAAPEPETHAETETAAPPSGRVHGVDTVVPESVGFASDRLTALDADYQALVDEGKLAGYVWLVSRHGQIADFNTYGVTNYDTQAPMRHDTIFRIASMTKPVTGVAMMMLYEDGLWQMDDPVSDYIPEFADLVVATEDGGTEPMLSLIHI